MNRIKWHGRLAREGIILPQMWDRPIQLSGLLECAANRRTPNGWLYLPVNWKSWNADTPAFMFDPEDIELADKEAAAREYQCTVDHQTLEDIIQEVSDVLENETFAARLQALIYYHRFDSFLPKLDAPDPPPAHETLLRLDREFYESLGLERPDSRCRASGCSRGTVKFSAFCRKHHFEQVKQRPCPFEE